MVNPGYPANPVLQSLSVASGAVTLDHIISTYSWDSAGKEQKYSKKYKWAAAILGDIEQKN